MDILISFDCTGSMMPCIHSVKQRVEQFVTSAMLTSPDTRMSIITHGDYEDSVPFTNIDFTSDKDALIQFIKTAPQTNGYDSDEMYEEVFYQAALMNWQSEKRIMIFFADANPHPANHRVLVKFNSLDVTYAKNWRETAKYVRDMGITMYPIQCLPHRQGAFYTELARMFGVPYLTLNQFSDAEQTILSIMHHSTDTLEQYTEGLVINRNMRELVARLQGKVTEEYTHSKITDTSKTYGSKSRLSFDLELERVHPARFQILTVDRNQDIKSFVLDTGATFKIGKGFYQLSKREEVQERKEIVLVDDDGNMWSGSKAREMLNLPFGSRGNLTPYDVPKGYTAYIQSTSNNRKLMKDTKFLYEAL